MAVNIFEELVKTALHAHGYFTIENVKYGLPENQKLSDEKFRTDESDIDIIAINPRSTTKKALAISCKGYSLEIASTADAVLNGGKVNGRDGWRQFRELASDEWAKAFLTKARQISGMKNIQHVLALTSYTGNVTAWRQNEIFVNRMDGIQPEVWDLGWLLLKVKEADKQLHATSEAIRLLKLFERV